MHRGRVSLVGRWVLWKSDGRFGRHRSERGWVSGRVLLYVGIESVPLDLRVLWMFLGEGRYSVRLCFFSPICLSTSFHRTLIVL
jgi:hypothetical protein